MNETPRRRVDLLLNEQAASQLETLLDYYKSKTEAIQEAIHLLYMKTQPAKQIVLEAYEHISNALQAMEVLRDYQKNTDLDGRETEAYNMLNRFWDEIRTLALFEEPFNDL